MKKNTGISKKILTLISKDEISKAIVLLESYLNKNEQIEVLIIQSARYSDLMRQIHSNTIDFTTASIEKNKIRLSLIDLAITIDEQIESDSSWSANKKDIVQNHFGSGDNISGDKIIQNDFSKS